MSLKNLFFKEDSTESQEEKKDLKKTGKISTPVSSGNAGSYTPTSLGVTQTFTTPAVNENDQNEFLEYFKSQFAKANFPGPDYQEFINALESEAVRNLPVDEASKFKMTFAGFQVQGVTPDKLVTTAKQYIDIVQKSVSNFTAEVENLLKSEVGGKQAKVDNLLKENEELDKQMAALAQRKTENFATVQKLTVEIQTESTSLQLKRTGFESAAKVFAGKIERDIQKIETYLR